MADKKLVEWKEVGRVVHYYNKLSVAVVRFKAAVKVGDTLRFVGGTETDFEQVVSSMEVDHKKVKKVKKGDEAGMEVKGRLRNGYKVYKE